MTPTFLINSADRSIIYDKHILGNVATYVFHYTFVWNVKQALIMFASMHQIKILLWNY